MLTIKRWYPTKSLIATLAAAIGGVGMSPSYGQNYSTTPSGASGMTTGTPGTTGSQMKLMQVRAQAYQAKKETEAASLTRSTDRALEEQNFSNAVEKSKQIKQLKEQAARQAEFEKASTGYNKVSSNDITRWTDNRGNIKVQRDLPPAFVNPLGDAPVPAAPQTMAQPETEDGEKKGFSPFKSAGNAVKKIGGMNPFKKKDEETGLRVPEVDIAKPEKEKKGILNAIPFVGKKDEVASETTPQATIDYSEPEKKGLLKGIGQKLPFGKKDKEIEYAEPAPTQQMQVQPAQTSTAPAPVRVQGNALVDGISQVNTNTVNATQNNTESVTTGSDQMIGNTVVTAPAQIEPEKPGIMGRLRNAGDKINPFTKDEPQMAPIGPAPVETGEVAAVATEPEAEKQRLMGKLFNKNKDESENIAAAETPDEKPGLMGRLRGIGGNGNRIGGSGTIDASLFPDGSTSAAPTGGELTSADPTALAATGEMATAPPAQELPGEEKKGFNLPKLSNLSLPSVDFSEVGKPDPTVPKKWKERSTAHKGGTDFYVVNSATNFMKFGNSQFNSQTDELPAGTIVRMTKPGDEWSSIQLANGAQGIVKNKVLRPAAQAEVPANFADAPAPSYASSIISSQPAPASTSVAAPPINLPTSQLPTDSGVAMDASLLPPAN